MTLYLFITCMESSYCNLNDLRLLCFPNSIIALHSTFVLSAFCHTHTPTQTHLHTRTYKHTITQTRSRWRVHSHTHAPTRMYMYIHTHAPTHATQVQLTTACFRMSFRKYMKYLLLPPTHIHNRYFLSVPLSVLDFLK